MYSDFVPWSSKAGIEHRERGCSRSFAIFRSGLITLIAVSFLRTKNKDYYSNDSNPNVMFARTGRIRAAGEAPQQQGSNSVEALYPSCPSLPYGRKTEEMTNWPGGDQGLPSWGGALLKKK